MLQNGVSVIPTFGFDRRDVKERYAYVTLAPSLADQKRQQQNNYNSNSNNNCNGHDEDTEKVGSPILLAFEPIIFSLRVCGLMFNRLDSDNKHVSKGLPAPAMIYCWLITFLGWGNVVFTFSSIRMVTSIGHDLVTVLIATAWQLLMSLNATGMLRNAHNPAHRQRFFRGFVHLIEYGGPYVDTDRLKRRCAILNAVFWLLSVGNTVFINYGMFNTEVYDIILANLISGRTADPRFILAVKVVNVGVTFYMSAMWCFPVCLELAIGWLLRTEFDLFRKAFAARLTAERGNTKSIEMERKRFLEMTKIVEAADNCLAIHHGAVFLCDIANICLMLYMLAYLPTPPLTISVSFTVWVIAFLADMGVVCYVGIGIDSGARKISNLLLEINVTGVTNDIALEVTLFLRNVDEFFGFTVCRLFTINRTVILSLGGMLITYFLLIVQFASTTTSMHGCQCNCTNTDI